MPKPIQEQTPEQVLVDGGYTMKNANIEAMAARGIDLNGGRWWKTTAKHLSSSAVFNQSFIPTNFDKIRPTTC